PSHLRGSPGRGSVALLVVVVVVAAAACASPAPPPPSAAGDQRTIADLRAQNAGYARHIEELQNRMLVLEDQLESRKLAAEQKAPAGLVARTLSAGPRVGSRAPAAGTAVITATTAAAGVE